MPSPVYVMWKPNVQGIDDIFLNLIDFLETPLCKLTTNDKPFLLEETPSQAKVEMLDDMPIALRKKVCDCVTKYYISNYICFIIIYPYNLNFFTKLEEAISTKIIDEALRS